MSKGPGIVQRCLLYRDLTTEWQTIAAIAASFDGSPNPTRSQTESVRRACRQLAAAGLAELNYIHGTELWSDLGDGYNTEPGNRPAHPHWQLAARLTSR